MMNDCLGRSEVVFLTDPTRRHFYTFRKTDPVVGCPR